RARFGTPEGGTRLATMRAGTLVVLEPGGLTASPAEGMVLWFGRNRPEVQICVGSDDPGVSRRHGTLEYSSGCWWVRTLGGRPVRVGRTHVLRKGDEPVPAADGRTSLLVEGADPERPAPGARGGGRRRNAPAPRPLLGHGAGPLPPARPVRTGTLGTPDLRLLGLDEE